MIGLMYDWSYRNNRITGMASRGRGNPSYRGGRGNTSNRGGRHYYGNNAIIAQSGQQKLIASNISGLSKSEHDIEIEEFKAWKSMQKQGNTPSSSTQPSYAKAGAEYNYTMNSDAKVILLLNEKDKKWANEPQILFNRYLSPHGYTMETYKTRTYYEQILVNNGCDFAHFSNSGKGKPEVYNFSKILITRIISIEDWGISPFSEKILTNNENGNTIKYNYWDYIQAFEKVLTYENPGLSHTWFIKIYSNIYTSFIPSWFINWWSFHGTKKEILPELIRQYYDEWLQVKPDPNADYNLPDEMRFFIEYSIPWIWKFTIETDNQQGYFCLVKKSQTRFWEKMMRKDETTGQLNCQITIDQLKGSIESYRDLLEHKKALQLQERVEFLAKLSEDSELDANNASEQELIEAYMLGLKKVLKAKKEEDKYMARFAKTNEDDKKSSTSDVSMNSNASQNVGLFQDAQSEDDDIDIEETLRKFLTKKNDQEK